MIVLEVLLRNTNGNSNKEYKLQLDQNQSGAFSVLRMSRRIGSGWISQGTLAQSANHAGALKALEGMVKDKLNGGYREVERRSFAPASQAPNQQAAALQAMAAKAKQATSVAVALSKPKELDEATLPEYLQDASMLMMATSGGNIYRATKREGTHLAVECRDGLDVALGMKAAKQALGRIPGEFVLDFEVASKGIVLLDLLSRGDRDLSGLSFSDRYLDLSFFFMDNEIKGAKLAFFEEGEGKGDFLLAAMDEGAHGVLFMPSNPSDPRGIQRYTFPKTGRAVVVGIHLDGKVALAAGAISEGPAYVGLPPSMKGIPKGTLMNLGYAKGGALALNLKDVVEFTYRYCDSEGNLSGAVISKVLPQADAASCSVGDIYFRLDA